jgi:Tol biopolymer transport system component
MHRWTSAVAAIGGALAALILGAAPAAAAYPGGSGLIAFTRSVDFGAGTHIWVMHPNGTGQRQLTFAAGSQLTPAWSPDGTRIAFMAGDQNRDVWVMDADGANPVRITTHASFDGFPTWSPDGTRLAFETRRDGDDEIFVIRSSAPFGRAVRLTANTVNDHDPAWSPTGDRIAFVRNTGRLATIDAATGRGLRLFATGACCADDPDWAPDARRLAFGQFGSAYPAWDVWRVNADGSGLLDLTRGPPGATAVHAAWAPGGGRIAFASDGIRVMNADGSNARQLTTQDDIAPDWQPLVAAP